MNVIRRVLGIALVMTALPGCGEPVAPEPEGAAAPVDEETQARKAAVQTVRSYCLKRPRRLGNQRRRQVATRTEALRALARLRSMARSHQAADDPDNPAWHDLVAGAGSFLEKTRCLPGAIARMDRELRFFETPEPEETYEDEVPQEDYEPQYP